MLTDLQLQDIKNNIPSIEVTNYETDYTSYGYIVDYKSEEFDLIFKDYHFILSIEVCNTYGDVESYQGFTEATVNVKNSNIKIVNIAINDKEYDFTEQQENEIINSIKEITFTH